MVKLPAENRNATSAEKTTPPPPPPKKKNKKKTTTKHVKAYSLKDAFSDNTGHDWWTVNQRIMALHSPVGRASRRWVGRQTQWWPRHKAIYFSWFGPELFCRLLGPPGFNCWFSSAPVFQWCCSTPKGSPGVGRNTFLSSPHLCFIIVFICDLFVSRDDPLMS